MDQHPVPQNISSYEFHLVGDLTLKQFFQLGGGIVLAVILFRTPLPGLIKYPLSGISAAIGILLAFVPVQGRPFSQWFVAFFKAVYSPTEYIWKQSSSPTSPLPSEALTIQKSEGGPLDNIESQLFSRFTELFSSSQANSHPIAQSQQAPISPPITTPPPSPLPPLPTPATPLYSRAPTPQVATAPVVPTVPITSASMFTPGPNIVSGLVQSTTGQSIEGAIVEITNTSTGLPVRALRTNRLGQFQIATPLPNGHYSISTEKADVTFPVIPLTTTGVTMPQLIIKAIT